MTQPFLLDKITAMVRPGRWWDGAVGGNTPLEARGSAVGHLVVDQGLPSLSELALAGKLFSVSPGVVANGVIPVVDQPTTASMYTLWNGNAQGSNIYLLPVLVFARAASGTLGLGASLITGATDTAQSSAVANSTGVVGPKNHKSDSTISSAAKWATGVTLASAPAWVDVAGRDIPAAVEIGAALSAFVWGMYAISPGCCLGTHVVAPTGTSAKFSNGVVYAEVRIINGIAG